MTEGSDAEKAALDQPPENVQQAQAAIHRYESDVCASEQPSAAEVDFSGEKKAAAYCDAIAKNNEMVGEVFAGGAKPDAIKALLTGKEFDAVLQAQRDNPPAVIAADVKALGSYWNERQVPTWETYDFDMRKAILNGKQADREVIQTTDPAIREHFARALAYEEQVCGE
jgi:hypothetical protein